ncbi:WAP four-disulfide core domain protein 18-like [Dendrobates tinctorius]|uniref:WAP four-disulfide core domain protein 18-like n=1 Tax=Dendrobates tinctorius TaxID=92724 RepID=UPI003CCA0BF0
MNILVHHLYKISSTGAELLISPGPEDMAPVKISFLLLFFLCCSGYPTSAVSPPKPSDVDVKPGSCEPDSSDTDCDTVDDSLCTQDGDCDYNMKCCQKGCQMDCSYPIFY